MPAEGNLPVVAMEIWGSIEVPMDVGIVGGATTTSPVPRIPLKRMDTDKGKIVLELYKNDAPGTVANFIKLVKSGFYNGIAFHRVIPGFMIQGGDPKGNGTGDAGYTIKCEVDNNRRRHQRGSLSMAHRGRDTGSCQFFICHVPTPHLDGKHTVFGQVIEGIEVVDRIEKGDRMKKVYMVKE